MDIADGMIAITLLHAERVIKQDFKLKPLQLKKENTLQIYKALYEEIENTNNKYLRL